MKKLNQNELKNINGGGPKGWLFAAAVGGATALAVGSGIGLVGLAAVAIGTTLLVSSER